MERRKVKNGEKSPWGQCLTQTSSKRSEARTAATVWNWSGKTLSPGALFAVLYFSSFHIQLFRERLSEKMCTRQSREVVWDMIDTLFLAIVAVEPTFVAFR